MIRLEEEPGRGPIGFTEWIRLLDEHVRTLNPAVHHHPIDARTSNWRYGERVVTVWQAGPATAHLAQSSAGGPSLLHHGSMLGSHPVRCLVGALSVSAISERILETLGAQPERCNVIVSQNCLP